MVITTTPLREQMRQALRIRNVSPRTESIYIHMVAGFAVHLRPSPDRLGRPHVEQYLLFVRDVEKVSCCWYNLRLYAGAGRSSAAPALQTGHYRL
ncbi:MAG: phage integrase N-terminal SAM-like domain-containing protein [Acidobacteriota bacterium]